jgi:mitochondrial chaperone BCS1
VNLHLPSLISPSIPILTPRRTTNKPNELDDALVRAGRISVRVGFTNASKHQAEEIFLRMFIDLPTTSSSRAELDSSSDPALLSTSEKSGFTDLLASLPDDETTKALRNLARTFAERIPPGDFSPADLQDYLLIHKKSPQNAVENVQSWIEKVYEERKKKADEVEAEREGRREERMREKERFSREVREAVRGLESEQAKDEGKDGFKEDGKGEEKGDNGSEGNSEEKGEAKTT